MKIVMPQMVSWFAHRSIRTKMTITFSIPLLSIALLLSFVSYHIIAERYAKQIMYSASQSYEQAVSYLNNHVQNMKYVQILLGTNQQLQKVFDGGVFEQQGQAQQYREYWRLDDIIVSIDLSNGMYYCSLYVPDEMIYSENNYHFFPSSQLPKDIEWSKYSSGLGGNLYFSDVLTVRRGNLDMEQVALLRMIYDKGGVQCVARVSVDIKELETILRNSDITRKGVSYLINNRDEIIASSVSEKAEYIRISEENKEQMLGKTGWVDVNFEGFGEYLVRRQEISDAGWTLVSMIEKADFYNERNVVLLVFALFVILMFPAIVLVSYSLARYYTKRLTRLSNQMMQLQKGEWNLADEEDKSEDEIGKLFEQFKYMTQELRVSMRNQYRLGQSVKSAELRALQAQINPHFLYNTLDLINWEARDHGAAEIVTIVQNLSKFYRISLNKGREIVKIADELEHVKSYVRIENYHFDDAIYLQINCEEEVSELGCINIILQPFVENAIMHGIAKNSMIKECHITIDVRREQEEVIFLIRDDGSGMTQEQLDRIFEQNTHKSTHGYGVQNINFRIKLFFGEQYGVSYQSEPGKGTCVTVRIPAMTVEEAEGMNTK